MCLKIQFQGGFCGKESEITFKNDDQIIHHMPFFPKGNILINLIIQIIILF